MTLKLAPEWETTDWLNTEEPLCLAALRGRVVMVHAFQMLCPGCVSRPKRPRRRATRRTTQTAVRTMAAAPSASGRRSLAPFPSLQSAKENDGTDKS